MEAIKSQAKKRLVLGGNRSGKSEFGAIEAISHAIGYRPYLDKNDINYFTGDTPTIGRIVGEDFTNHIGSVIIPKLHDWIPKSEFKEIKKNARGQDTNWIFKNGSTIELMSYEQDSDKFEGWSGDWVWFDEPPPREIYIACMRGLIDRGGKAWFTMTPLKEPWIYNELFLNEKKDKDIWTSVWDMHDNIGYGLGEDEVRKFESSLMEHEKMARIHGKFRFLTGLVYSEFDPLYHVVKSFTIPSDWPIFEAIDPHPRTPHAVTWIAVSPDNTKYVFDELFKVGYISEICNFIKAKRKGRNPRVTLIDPASCTPNPISGIDIKREFTRNGIYPIKASKELHLGINRVKKALAKNPFGKSELYVMENCVETIKEFQMYIWDDYRGRQKDTRKEKENPLDKDDHMMENLYRLLLFEPKYQNVYRKDYEAEMNYNNFTGY